MKKHVWVWKVPIAIVFPILGLLINEDTFKGGFFGNFSNHWFYILAVLNGILVCLPEVKNKRYRFILFIGRSITFTFILYFFLVFLPFLPLSVIAIIGVGFGLLMLTPLVLFVIQIQQLSKDFSYLQSFLSKKIVSITFIISVMIIPICVTISYLQDIKILYETLSYVYSPDYSKKYDIDKKSLKKTLHIVNSHKEQRRTPFFNRSQPYLSSYFSWLVLDNLTLSDSKINTIEKIFFGKSSFDFPSDNIQNKDVKITHISTKSTYDTTQNAWKSWIGLEITNKANTRFAEYATIIDLPQGCWISDYYLYVGDKKESGILAEKKSALWVFSQIRNENRDPGILHYLTGNKIVFRVFPFAKDEVRKTGVEFLHKEPIKLDIDGNTIELGNVEKNNTKNIENENIAYISAKDKKQLARVKRKPYFHFLLDVSKDKKRYSAEFIQRIKQAIKADSSLFEDSKLSFVNTYVHTLSLNDDWEKEYENQSFEGGFYLDRAIRTTLFEAYEEKVKKYPVIVVVTDDISRAVLNNDFSDFKFTFPESNLFYHLTEDAIHPHSLVQNPMHRIREIEIKECTFCDTVLAYEFSDSIVAYLPNNDRASIVLKKPIFDIHESEIKEKNWLSALLMQGQWRSQVLYPKEASNKAWLNLIKNSFYSKVMMPQTSYIVVENEAQKAILKKKQKQVLSGNKLLDIGEGVRRMSEPSWILWTLIFIGLIGYSKKRKIREDSKNKIDPNF